MGDVVSLPIAVDAAMLDRLVSRGHLRPDQRRDWRAVGIAIDRAFIEAVFDPRPELSMEKVLEQMRRMDRPDDDPPEAA
jgi:hypothetical protein